MRSTVSYCLRTFVLIIGMLAASASAATITWQGGVDNNFSTGGNWVGGSAPGSSDDAVIASTSNSIVYDTGAPSTLNSLSLNSGFTGSLTLAQSLTTTN